MTDATHDLVRPRELGRLLASRLGDDRWEDLEARLISGGKSNLTFEISSGAGTVILRRPPSGHILASAHDMGREARVQRALADTPIPVPRVLLTDEDVLGVECYVMEKVDGVVVRDELPPGFADADSDRVRIADALVDTLVELHRVDPAAVGLADFGRPAGYMRRQLERWRRQSAASREDESGKAVAGIGDCRALDALHDRLTRCVPESGAHTIVHGDFRLDNCMLAPTDPGRVVAVLDWELSTLGDPLADVGMFLLYWGDPERPRVPLVPSLTRDGGFPPGARLVERYADATGVEVGQLRIYQAFAHFKFAVIAQGVARRATEGVMAGQDFGDISGGIDDLVATGCALLDEAGAP